METTTEITDVSAAVPALEIDRASVHVTFADATPREFLAAVEELQNRDFDVKWDWTAGQSHRVSVRYTDGDVLVFLTGPALREPEAIAPNPELMLRNAAAANG